MNDKTDTSVAETEVKHDDQKPMKDPVRKWTWIMLILALVLMIWYLAADRITPYTTQARLHAQVVPIAAEVSGHVTEVAVSNNQVVAAGDMLFSPRSALESTPEALLFSNSSIRL